MKSILTRHQEKKFEREYNGYMCRATIRYDDRFQNGHNTFSITGESNDCYGMIHDIIAEVFPEFKPLLKWNLCSSDGPAHYIVNSLYHASDNYRLIPKNKPEFNMHGERKIPNLEAARDCAIWPEAELEDFTEEKLLARLPKLKEEFKAMVESLGFIY